VASSVMDAPAGGGGTGNGGGPAKRFSAPARGGPAKGGRNAWEQKRRDGPKKALKARVSFGSDDGDMRRGGGKRRGKKGSGGPRPVQVKPKLSEVTIPEVITVGDLAELLETHAAAVIKDLMKMGILASVSQSIQGDQAAAVAEAMGLSVTRGTDIDVEARALEQDEDTDEQLKPRPPVVTVMGHVDHGKTSLLDALRKSRVAAGEAGGITQHLGSYQIDLDAGGKITFLDTPGHAAFSAMRSRGANLTDIVVLVVAADDGVKQQTVEAIKAAKAAECPIIVAINKIDKEGADPEKVGVELLDHDVILERFGGEVLTAEVSALKGTGLEDLEDKIQLMAELLNLRANPNRMAEGVAVEARMERGLGPVATTIVQRGTLRVGDIIVAGSEWGRVRKLLINGVEVDEAPPGAPVDCLGLQGVPKAGDDLRVAATEQLARQIAEVRQQRDREERAAMLFAAQAEEKRGELFGERVRDDKKETIDVVIKADVQGSAEALRAAIEELKETDSFGYSAHCRVLRADAGALTLEDIQLASVSGALVVAFNVNPTAATMAEAQKLGIEVLESKIVYDALDEVTRRLADLVAPPASNWLGTVTGRAEVLQTFKIGKGIGMVAGCKVLEGEMKRGSNLRVMRGKQVMHEGSINQLRYLKEEVEVVEEGSECGISFETFDGVKQGDVIECYIGGGSSREDDDESAPDGED